MTDFTHDLFLRLFGLWAASAFLFQTLLRFTGRETLIRCLWLTCDAVFITRMLILAAPPVGPLVAVYPLLIVVSGLFFHEGLVLFMTSVTLVAYAVFLWNCPWETRPGHYPLMLAAMLVVVGLVTAHQVHRLRSLNRHLGP